MLLIQKYLQNKTFKDLADNHGVYASFSKSGHKFSLNYDQIEATESDPLAQEARGLILSANGKSFLSEAEEKNNRLSFEHICPGNTMVLAFPMKRFFNNGQGAAADINWKDPNLLVQEKLDGTLTILYFDIFTDQWCVATRSVPEADIPIDILNYTFRSLFERALQETTGKEFNKFTEELDKSKTYCFELTTPINRIVVNYTDYRVTLLAIRCNKTFDEHHIHNIQISVPIVKSYNFSNINEVIDFVNTNNPLEHEGVVIKDNSFNRIKVKNAAYVAYNKARDSLGSSDRNCLELILLEKDDDVIPALPQEIADHIIQMKAKFLKFIKKSDAYYDKIIKQVSLNDRKAFALLIQANKDIWGPPFFAMYSNKAKNTLDFIKKSQKNGSWSNSILDNILKLLK